MRNTRKNGRVIDFVTVQVKDRQNCSVACRVQEFIGVPCGGEGACFCFAVADRYRCDEVRVIENCAESMRDGITEFAAFVDGTGGFRCNVAGNASRERKLFAQFFHAFIVLADVRIDFAVSSFEIRVCNKEVSAMSGA